RVAPAMATPQWRRYPAVACIDPAAGQVLVVGDDDAAVGRLAKEVQATPPPPPDVRCVLDYTPAATEHVRRVARARELIVDGDLYQVSLARRFGFELRGIREPDRASAMVQLY